MALRSPSFLAIVTLFTLAFTLNSSAATSTSRALGGRLAAKCAENTPDPRSYASRVAQLITVTAPPRSTMASLSMWQRRDGCFMRVAGSFEAYLGRSGLSAHKVEGDGATPVGIFDIGATMFGVSVNPGLSYPYHRVVCGDWWDEDPRSNRYNHFVHLPCGQVPGFAGNSEALWKVVPAYNYFAVVGYNSHPVIDGRGSAIFLHESTGGPTAGCISLPGPELVRVLRALRPALHPEIALSLVAS